jgi:hypothetical protein
VKNASFRLKDHYIEVEVKARQATLDFALSSLLVGTLEIESLKASGVRYRMLHRVEDKHRVRLRLPKA